MEKINNGLGGLLIHQVLVAPYIKDLSQYEITTEYETHFDITHWQFFMAFDGDVPVGGITLASRTENVEILEGLDDLCVLWDICIED